MNFIPAVAPQSRRNKGIICKSYFNNKSCAISNCPYAHIADGDELPVPEAVCLFFQQNKCLREHCKFFHGSKSDFAKVKASGSATYRPQDFMTVEAPPTDAPQSVMIPIVSPQPPPMPMQQPIMMAQPQMMPNTMMMMPQMSMPMPMPMPMALQQQQQMPFFYQPMQLPVQPQQQAGSVGMAPQLVMSNNGQIFALQPMPFGLPSPANSPLLQTAPKTSTMWN